MWYAMRRWLPKFPSDNEEKTVTTEPYTQENDRRGDRCAGSRISNQKKLYSGLPPITKTIQNRRLALGGHVVRHEEMAAKVPLWQRRKEGDPGSSNISEPFLLVADYDGEIILQVNITTGSTTTLPLGDVGQPIALDHDSLTDYVYWSDNLNQKIHRARRDGSGRETILDISCETAYGAPMGSKGA
ncbi:hypothetical protein Bbelb_242340 [Branchiostoma belcheri]|nr:hypothetical protein Bbelb_242340 [Branchiostoma belcheri]